MKLTHWIVFLTLCVIGTSCIQDEALNAEADILACIVPEGILKMDPMIDDDTNKITLMVKSDTDLAAQAPEFTLTPGATIVPASGTKLNFMAPQTYTVTSEDGIWKKKYEVTYIVAGIGTQYSFEHVEQPDKTNYQVFFETDSDGERVMTWASGNPGYAFTGATQNPEEYPTVSATDGKIGKCLKLTTRSTGSFGAKLGMPIAAGNLFMGKFDVLSAVTNALKATQFGLTFEYVPTYLSGYYKFKSGDLFQKNGKDVPGKKDKCDIYAVFYETDDKVKMLDGLNVFTSPNLVSIARINDQKETDEWTHFYLPFTARLGKAIDKKKLKDGKYNVAIVFSSSIDGGSFSGAVGSTLYIDEVELVYAAED